MCAWLRRAANNMRGEGLAARLISVEISSDKIIMKVHALGPMPSYMMLSLVHAMYSLFPILDETQLYNYCNVLGSQ